MKILIITRIYSGLVDSIKSRKWQPKGMPAYCKLLELLDKKYDVDAVCLGKVIDEEIETPGVFTFPGFKTRFHIVPFRKIPISRYFNRNINEILQFFYCLRLIQKTEYDLIYVDRINVIIGAIFAFFFKKKVVLRFYSVANLIKRMSGWRKFKEPIRYLSFKAPFAHIICTKEGSGTQYFLNRFINKRTPYEILLNGVDKIDGKQLESDFIRARYNLPGDRKIILFLTRLTYDKGAQLFVEALDRLNKMNHNFFALMVGNGNLKEKLESEVKRYNLSDKIRFEKAVPYNEIYDYFCSSDIYISLNMIGNLCNTVLEAINAGKCIVTFKKDKLDHTDEDTENILKEKAVLINKRRVLEELPEVLNGLLNDEEKIKELSLRAQELSRSLLQTWDERINHEIALFQRVANENEAKEQR